jgi:uncharacterized protein YjbJ (UPF0337 family)
MKNKQNRSTGSQPNIREEEYVMKPSTEDKTKGKFHEVKGKIKEKAGKVSMDSKLEANGKAEKRVGIFQQVIGKVEKVLGK